MLVFSWMKKKRRFLKVKSCNPFYGFGTLTRNFLYRLLEHRNWILSLMSLKFHPNLSFTYETSKERVKFLYLTLSIRNGAISTDLYIRPTDGHKSLHCKSSHPEHIKNSIPYSQVLKLSRICSSEKDFKGHIDRMKGWFLARDYPKNVVNEQTNKVVFGKSQPRRILKMVFLL